MGLVKYNKLVRDNIPETIEADGKTCICKTLQPQEYLTALNSKLIEETNEYLLSQSDDELADILEIIYAIVKAKRISFDSIEKLRQNKASTNGSFDNKILLKAVFDSNTPADETVLKQEYSMISQHEFICSVDVQSETISRYLRDGLIVPDAIFPVTPQKFQNYYFIDTVEKYARQYGWNRINDENRKDVFMRMVRKMDMSYSYKPILLKGILNYADDAGVCRLTDIVKYFKDFFDARRECGLLVEKQKSIYLNACITNQQILQNILIYPYRRFSDIGALHLSEDRACIYVDSTVWTNLTHFEIREISRVCDQKLQSYFDMIDNPVRMAEITADDVEMSDYNGLYDIDFFDMETLSDPIKLLTALEQPGT
ncbi:MAG: nucleoside triphosphate pyrophosphohydrolase [Christensenellaceae bacterium]